MAYKSGSEWKGNNKGRPFGSKTSDIRNTLARELATEIHGDTKEIIQLVIQEAKMRKEWALKLYINGILPYLLGKPKAEEEEGQNDNKTLALNLATNLPAEILGQIRQLILKSQEKEDD